MPASPNVLVPCSACEGVSNRNPCQHLTAVDGWSLSKATQHNTAINQLPPEIIAECLYHALPTIEDYNDASREYVISPMGPSVLAAVCKRWRDTACATPSLWAIVPVIVAKDRDPRPMAYALEVWLARSGVLPLEVIIDAPASGRRYYGDEYRDDVERIVGMVNAQAHRVVVLRVRAGDSVLRYLDFETVGARKLRRVEIFLPEAEGGYSPEGNTDLKIIPIGPATEPTALVLEHWTIPQLGVGTDRLTHVVLTLRNKDVLDVLDRAPRLVSCSFTYCSSFSNSAVKKVYHSNLRTLEIFRCKPDASSLVLESVRLPRLESFRIHDHISGTGLLEQILPFLHRSSNPPLAVLHLVEVRIAQEGVDGLLAAIVRCVAPTLRDLAFTLSKYWPPMDVMRSHELVGAVFGTGVELPLLSSLTLYGTEYRWSHTLLCLVREFSRISTQMPPQIKLYILSVSSEIVTVASVLTVSCFDQTNVYPVQRLLCYTNVCDELPGISSEEILEMMALIDRHSLSVTVYIDSMRSDRNFDIFPELRTRLLDMCNT